MALPRASARLRWHTAASSSMAGAATSCSPSPPSGPGTGEVNVRSRGLSRQRSDPRPTRLGRNGPPPGGRLQAEVEQALVGGLVLDGTRLAGRAEMGLEGDRVEGDEGVDRAADLAR